MRIDDFIEIFESFTRYDYCELIEMLTKLAIREENLHHKKSSEKIFHIVEILKQDKIDLDFVLANIK